MKKIKKIWTNGFTLLEMLIVILLTSIVFSLTFLYFNTFKEYVKTLTESSGIELEVLRMESLIHYDMDRTPRLIVDEGSFTQIICSEAEVIYTIDSEKIIRSQQGGSDTLKFESVYFEPIFYGNSDYTMEGFTLQLIDYKKRIRNYSFYKPSSAKFQFEEHWNEDD